MPENITSFRSLELLFADYVQSILGLNGNQVLISYRPTGQISSAFGDTVVYINAAKEANEVDHAKQLNYESLEDSIQYTMKSARLIKMRFVFYGNDIDVLATKLNESFFQYSGKDFLHKNNLALVAEMTSFSAMLHEQFNGRWWDRIDLEVHFYNSTAVIETVDVIEDIDLDIKYN